MIIRAVFSGAVESSALPPEPESPKTETGTACTVSPEVRIVLQGSCWSVQQLVKGQWSNIGYHGGFYFAVDWLLRRRPDLLTTGQLSHLDSLLRAYDVALAQVRTLVQPLEQENRDLRARVAQLESAADHSDSFVDPRSRSRCELAT